MYTRIRGKHVFRLVGILLALLLLGGLAAGSRTARAANDDREAAAPLDPEPAAAAASPAAVDCEDTSCPTVSGLPYCVERPKFCVYYHTDSISQTEAEWAADIVQLYWDRFVALGFNEPKYSTRLGVELTNTAASCNGGSSWDSNRITTYATCFATDLVAKSTLGHELTHRVQYAHDSGPSAPVQTKFLKEGTARATEDNWFTDIDHRTDALTASFSFNKELNAYLTAPNNDLTSYDLRYKSCLWWKYAMEQYGTTPTEPQLGLDFVEQVYEENTAGFCSIAAVNQALSHLGAGTNFTEAFKQFAVANWTKDLAGVPDGSYNYVDEDEVGSPAPYGPVVTSAGGPISPGTPAEWSDQNVSRYGLSYYAVDVDPDCPVVSVSFHRDDAGPAFYHIITQDGSTFKSHVRGSGADWTQAFLNDGITKVMGIIGSLDNSSQVDVAFQCVDPVLDIKLPNSVAVARVQADTKFLAQVLVTGGGAVGGPVVAGLTNSDFVAEVDGVEAMVTGGGFIQEQYWLLIQAPDLPDGTYDLEIRLQAPGIGTPLASDVNADSVVYTVDKIDQVLVIDRSGSMGWGTEPRLPAAQDAATFYVDVTRDGDGLSVVPYHTDVDPPPFDMAPVDSTVREDAKAYINGLTPANTTSIGDGLYEAVKQRDGSPTGNPLCSFVLLSDGMENTEKYWADVQADVIDSGCPVTAIAFGPESDETLMQEIATATGGLYFYNDVYVSAALGETTPAALLPADVALELGNTYEYAEGRGEGRQRLLAEKGIVSQKDPEAGHKVLVDEMVSEVIFALDWYTSPAAELKLELIDPDGKPWGEGYTFFDLENGHLGWRISRPMAGLWTMVVTWASGEMPVPYQVLVSGRSNLTLELLLPDRLGRRFATGNRVPIYAILSAKGPIPDALVEAFVTAPGGQVTLVPLFDDGQHGDGAAADGLYAGLYTRVNQAAAVPPQGEEQQIPPHSEGAYRVLARATHDEFQREAQGAFAVPAGLDENKNRLPDPWEEEYGVSDPTDDPDLDSLSNYREYQEGTDPNDSDTDDGGENDGSEVNHGREPLDPADDGIRRPDFFLASPLSKAVLLQYDHKPLNGGSGSAYSLMRLFRAPGATGPWRRLADLRPTGIYTDTEVTNGLTYYYRLAGVADLLAMGGQEGGLAAAETISSTVLSSEPVTPSSDPFPPEALVIIDGGAPSTPDLDVTLSFAPYEGEGDEALERFKDIEWMMISNDPSFLGTRWQSFAQDVPWHLDAQLGEVARVYVRFRDAAGNESVAPELGMILYQSPAIYLPVVLRNSP